MKKYIWYSITFLILIFLIILNLINNNKIQEFSTNLFYMDTYINVKIYTNDKKKANNALSEIDNIYKKYHQLTDRYNSYENVNNVHYLNNNNSKEEKIKIEEELYDIIDYGIIWHNKSSGLLNINLGNVIDVWKQYRENRNGVPTIEELQNSGSINISDIVLLENNYILNNHPNIDLGAIAKGYATGVVGEYLKEKGFNKFLIYAGGNILVGDHYYDEKFKIGIEDPTNPGDIYKIIKGNNIAVVTSGGYERFYEYEGNLYHHIIDPNTLMPPNYMKSVSIITQDSKLGDVLSTILFLMPIKKGQQYIKQFDNVEAIWYTNEGKVVKSSGFDSYE